MQEEWDRNRERWMGKVDEELRSMGRNVSNIENKITEIEKQSRNIELKVQALATKLLMFSSFGAFFGGGIMSFIVGFFFKH